MYHLLISLQLLEASSSEMHAMHLNNKTHLVLVTKHSAQQHYIHNHSAGAYGVTERTMCDSHSCSSKSLLTFPEPTSRFDHITTSKIKLTCNGSLI